MNFITVKLNALIFIFSFFLFVLLFSYSSYKFIINDSLELEKKKNLNNVNTIVNIMNHNLEHITKITNDYSKWDDTYAFMIDGNKDYINENFREGTNTLELLDASFIIYLNKKNKVLFSKYQEKVLEKNNKDFEKILTNKFSMLNSTSTIIKYNSLFMYIVKAEVLKSDFTGSVQGWIYSGKVITNKNINHISTVFKSIKLSEYLFSKENYEISLSLLKNIKFNAQLFDKELINTIAFYDVFNHSVFSIITKSDRELINNSEKTIFILDSFTAFFLFIITLIIYKSQKVLINYNKLLEIKVNRRTHQLSKSLRKLQTSNKKLYTLANIDTLTKICNRRSYFNKSEKLLTQAIKENKTFYVLMIDIDHFKKVNDTYGHAIGDKVLIEFCMIINTVISDEVFARIGGEEFCITFFNTEEEKINTISENIRKACEQASIKINDKKIKFTISLGLSSRAEYTNIDDILCVCDELLYKAKDGGRNRLVRSSPHSN